jgi:hypothetical protein
MFCSICATPHDSCISDNSVQASICHCGKVHSSKSTIKYAGSCHSYLLEVPYMVQVQNALYFSMAPQCQTCSMRFYTITLKAEMSVHQELVTKCKLTVLKTESSINGFPSCQKIKNAPLWPKRQFTHFYKYGLLFSLGISYDAIPTTGTLVWGPNGKISFHHQSHVQQEVIWDDIFQDIVQASWYLSFLFILASGEPNNKLSSIPQSTWPA